MNSNCSFFYLYLEKIDQKIKNMIIKAFKKKLVRVLNTLDRMISFQYS